MSHKVFPSSQDGLKGNINPSFAADDNIPRLNVDEPTQDKHTLPGIANVGYGVTKFENLSRKRRPIDRQFAFKHTESHLSDDMPDIFKGCLEISEDEEVEASMVNGKLEEKSAPVPIKSGHLNRKLINQFVKFQDKSGNNGNEEDEIDFDVLEDLFKQGANVNVKDKYGQTLLHEVATTWNVGVAEFLCEHGADVNKGDKYGRTPLHVAAATNYSEMIDFFVSKNANIEARTEGEKQTPMHFAARNDATEALKKLKELGADMEAKDYKIRTPLHVAAELDRSETARLLVEMGADVFVRDENGQTCMTFMVSKMGPVAHETLDQFHKTDRANRKQYFYLNHLEHASASVSNKRIANYTNQKNNAKRERIENNLAKTALEMIVHLRQLELIMHPVILKLIEIKYEKFAKKRALFQLTLNLIYIILWTVLAVSEPWMTRYEYNLPGDWWRIFLWVLAVIATFYFIGVEVFEILLSNRKFRAWKAWKLRELDRDIKYCHPKWPAEKSYLLREKNVLEEAVSNYFSDFWNLFDWTVYLLNIITLVTHLVDVTIPADSRVTPCCQVGVSCENITQQIQQQLLTSAESCQLNQSYVNNASLSTWNNRIFVLTIILLWFRLMKNTRTFKTLGPFVVMLGKMTWDIVRFFYLYMEFYIPYACAFWMIFGNQSSISSMSTVDQMLFSLYRITLVDDYQYDEMHSFDIVMAYLLIGTFLGFSAILCINLFIALLSDTFQRVYDNAQSNATMQQAIFILNVEDKMSNKTTDRYRRFYQNTCAPLSCYYDDDLTTDGEQNLKKVTIQINEKMDELMEYIGREERQNRIFEAELLQEADHYRRSSTSFSNETDKLPPLTIETPRREPSFLNARANSNMSGKTMSNLSAEHQARLAMSSGMGVQRASVLRESARATSEIMRALNKLQTSHMAQQDKMRSEMREMKKMLKLLLKNREFEVGKMMQQEETMATFPHPVFQLQSVAPSDRSYSAIETVFPHSASVPGNLHQAPGPSSQSAERGSAESLKRQLQRDVISKKGSNTKRKLSEDFEMSVLPGLIDDSTPNSSSRRDNIA